LRAQGLWTMDTLPTEEGDVEACIVDAGCVPAALSFEWAETADNRLGNDAGSLDGAEAATCLRVLTLNILADGLARGSTSPAPDMLEPCPPLFEEEGTGGVVYRPGAVKTENDFRFCCNAEALAWTRRWPMLRSMILELEPDLIGLQEVDLLEGGPEGLRAHDKEIRRDLSAAGYDGTFARKMGRACDGVALFWRRTRLRAGRTETWRLGKSVHVALAQTLCLDEERRFTAVATHFKAGLSEEAENARVEQASVLLQRLRNHPNAVVLADLNATCRPVAAGGGPDGAPEAQLEPRAYPLLAETLQSACRTVLGDEPSFTCWGGWEDREVRLVCDYVFLKGALLDPQRVLRVPAAAEVLRYPERLPNPHYPTDHVPIAADLAVAGSDTQQPEDGWQVRFGRKRQRQRHQQLSQPFPP